MKMRTILPYDHIRKLILRFLYEKLKKAGRLEEL
jgi:hypothetical protein